MNVYMSRQVKSSSYSPHKYKIAPLQCLVRVVCAAGRRPQAKFEPPWCKVVRAAGEIARSWGKPWGQPTRALSVLLQTDHIGEVRDA
jgi:hypothetical protein